MIEQHLCADQIAAVEQQSRAHTPHGIANEDSQQRRRDAGQADQCEFGDTWRLSKKLIVQSGIDNVEMYFGTGHVGPERRAVKIVKNTCGRSDQDQLIAKKLSIVVVALPELGSQRVAHGMDLEPQSGRCGETKAVRRSAGRNVLCLSE